MYGTCGRIDNKADFDFWLWCDTEDWSNDTENTDLITEINYSLKYIKIEKKYFKLQ